MAGYTVTFTMSPNTLIRSSQANQNWTDGASWSASSAMDLGSAQTVTGAKTFSGADTLLLPTNAPTVNKSLALVSSALQFHDGTSARTVVDLHSTQTITGPKTFSGANSLKIPSAAPTADNAIGNDGGILKFQHSSSVKSLMDLGTAQTATAKKTFGAALAGYNNLGNSGSGTKTCDLSLYNRFRITADNDFTLAMSNPSDGQPFTIAIVQDSSGGHTVTWPSAYRWLNKTGATDSTTDAPPLTTTGDKVDIISGFYDSTSGKYWVELVGKKGAIT